MDNETGAASSATEQQFPTVATEQGPDAAPPEAAEQSARRKSGPKPRVRNADGDEASRAPVAEEMVTYTPGPGDNPEVTWMAHKFKAHVPHPVRNGALIEKARGNKFFHVGEFDPGKHAYQEKVAEPKTAEAYRAWAIHWAKAIWLNPDGTIDELCERWSNEARTRNRLEVGFDDYHYMSHLFQPMVDDLVRRDEEPRRKRDELIRNRELEGLILQIAGVGQAAA